MVLERREDYPCREGGWAMVSDLPTATHVYDFVAGRFPDANNYPDRLEGRGILRVVYGPPFMAVVIVNMNLISAQMDRRIRNYYGQWFNNLEIATL